MYPVRLWHSPFVCCWWEQGDFPRHKCRGLDACLKDEHCLVRSCSCSIIVSLLLVGLVLVLVDGTVWVDSRVHLEENGMGTTTSG